MDEVVRVEAEDGRAAVGREPACSEDRRVVFLRVGEDAAVYRTEDKKSYNIPV